MESEDKKIDAVTAAEQYRRERQASDAAKSGMEPRTRADHLAWFNEHKAVAVHIARRAGASEQEAESVVAQFIERVMSVPSASNFDDLTAQMILMQVVEKVEAACEELNLPVRNGVVYGTARSPHVTARQKPVFDTNTSIVELGLPFITLCDLLSKVLVHTVCTSLDNGQIRFAMTSDAITHRLRSERWLMREWRRLLLYYTVRDRPPPRLGLAPVGVAQGVRGMNSKVNGDIHRRPRIQPSPLGARVY